MKCKSKVDGGYFRLNDKGKWVKVNAPVQDTLPFNLKGIPFKREDETVEFRWGKVQFPIPPVGVGKSDCCEQSGKSTSKHSWYRR